MESIFLFVQEVHDMALPNEVVEEVFQVIEGGANLGTPADIIPFPSDNGQNTFNVVQKTYQGSNGTAFNYWVLAFETLVGEVATAVSGGAALLTMEVTGAAAMILPALGVTAGVAGGIALYEVSPGFWDNLTDALIDAGETINGKVVAFMNEEGNIVFSDATIEAIKNAFLDEGIFALADLPEYSNTGTVEITSLMNPLEVYNYAVSISPNSFTWDSDVWARFMAMLVDHKDDISCIRVPNFIYDEHSPGWDWRMQLSSYSDEVTLGSYPSGDSYVISFRIRALVPGSIEVVDVSISGPHTYGTHLYTGSFSNEYDIGVSGINGVWNNNDAVQEGALVPNEDPFPLRYPGWHPWEFPIIDPEGTPQQLPDGFPIEYPDLLPETVPYQDPAQNPDPAIENNPDEVVETLEDPERDPRNAPEEEPIIEPDPDPQPEPEPIPEDPDPSTNPDPINPNPTPGGSLPIVVPSLPTSVSSNKLFTVYNPTSSQLDALGGYLWDASIIGAIRDIWQDPLDGIISLQQVYVTPTTGGNHNIILGFLDSGISSAVVSNQFVTVDCGTVSVPENKQNATDYAPYTSLHIYLPFIGIVELDTNECMNSDITVTYQVDVYTGTCLAQVSITRNPDMPNDPILYTFSGNCSQQIPLTSGNASGALRGLMSAISAGITIASGGGVGVVAGAKMLGESLNHEMFHISHSGNLSSNAGIMGIKKPYLIIGRRHNYDANAYNKFYGFPVNKTVVLGNHSGFVRIKKCWLKTKALKEEYNEIMRMLEEGVFV